MPTNNQPVARMDTIPIKNMVGVVDKRSLLSIIPAELAAIERTRSLNIGYRIIDLEVSK
jgi:hypothetical protein